MSLGAVFGAMYAMNNKALKIFYRKEIAYTSILLAFVLWFSGFALAQFNDCLLYTSDAADERSSVDLGGRRIIKKKNRQKLTLH